MKEPSAAPHEALAGYPVVIGIPVQWGDMDAYEHVNNTVYFRWFESARIAYTSLLGFADMKRVSGVGPILASQSCDYRRPLVFPDTVRVGSRVVRIGRTSFGMDHVVVSEAIGGVAATCSSTIVAYDYKASRPVPVPEDVRRAIRTIEKNESL